MLVGEPGHPVANGSTGRKQGRLTPVDAATGHASLPATMDHDFRAFAKVSLSVNIFIRVPRHLAHSWLRGPVCVTVRCCALDPSTIWRHVAELAMQLLTWACTAAGVNAIRDVAHFRRLEAGQKQRILQHVPVFLVITTDGGGDHNNASVQNQCAYMNIGVCGYRCRALANAMIPLDAAGQNA